MYLDDQDSLELSINSVHEPFETKILGGLVREGGVVLDVGANIGYYTLQFARQVGANGHVFAFEPDAANFELLGKNLQVNGYANVTLIKQAVSNYNGPTRLYLSARNRGDHRTYQSDEHRESTEIQSIRLSDHFKAVNQPIDLIKMDIQGAEYQAFLGMQELLLRNPGVVLVTEFWPYGIRRSGAPPQAYLELIAGSGFELFEISEEKETVERIEPRCLLEKLGDSMEESTNLMCRRISPASSPRDV